MYLLLLDVIDTKIILHVLKSAVQPTIQWVLDILHHMIICILLLSWPPPETPLPKPPSLLPSTSFANPTFRAWLTIISGAPPPAAAFIYTPHHLCLGRVASTVIMLFMVQCVVHNIAKARVNMVGALRMI